MRRTYFTTPLGRLSAAAASLLIAAVAAVAVAFACVPAASVSVLPRSGPVGTEVTVNGDGFPAEAVDLRWDSETGPMLATTSGPSFSVKVRVPTAPDGSHLILAVIPSHGHAAGRETFSVTSSTGGAPPPTSSQPQPTSSQPSPASSQEQPAASGQPSAQADSVGPAVFAAALTAANGNRRVSRNGSVKLFCGRFEEAGVTGVCGARSARRVKVRAVGKGRSGLLRLRDRPFRAKQGVPVLLRFRLASSSMRVLRAAKKVPMRGTVVVRDALGNATKAGFRFTLKAPG